MHHLTTSRHRCKRLCLYLEPVCPLFWWLNPPKQGLFQSKQGSFGFQVFIYIYIYNNDITYSTGGHTLAASILTAGTADDSMIGIFDAGLIQMAENLRNGGFDWSECLIGNPRISTTKRSKTWSFQKSYQNHGNLRGPPPPQK